MSIDAQIISALSGLGIPIENAVYSGTEKEYLVFNYSSLPTLHADDNPEYERYLIQVHYFAPLSGNINSKIRQIKTALSSAGFLYPETENASDESGRHIVFETENAEGINYGQI